MFSSMFSLFEWMCKRVDVQYSIPFDLSVKEYIKAIILISLYLFLINWDISICQWLMDFQLTVDLIALESQ
jgi:hypothetical protein